MIQIALGYIAIWVEIKQRAWMMKDDFYSIQTAFHRRFVESKRRFS